MPPTRPNCSPYGDKLITSYVDDGMLESLELGRAGAAVRVTAARRKDLLTAASARAGPDSTPPQPSASSAASAASRCAPVRLHRGDSIGVRQPLVRERDPALRGAWRVEHDVDARAVVTPVVAGRPRRRCRPHAQALAPRGLLPRGEQPLDRHINIEAPATQTPPRCPTARRPRARSKPTVIACAYQPGTPRSSWSQAAMSRCEWWRTPHSGRRARRASTPSRGRCASISAGSVTGGSKSAGTTAGLGTRFRRAAV